MSNLFFHIHTMPRNKRTPKRGPFRITGSGQLSGALSSTSAVGAFVSTRYEIDTTLVQSWGQAGQLFARWRIVSLIFHFKSLKGTTTDGNMGICFLPDPQETTPTSTASAYAMESATFGHIYQNLSLRCKVKHSKWLYTRDALALDDRLEMPGDIVYWSENCAASFTPGIASVSYVVEFDQIGNSTTLPMSVDSAQTSSSNNKEEEDLSPNELAVALTIAKKLKRANADKKQVEQGKN